MGFAIPINTAKAVLDDFAKARLRRPTLDIVPLPIGPDLADQLGLPSDYGGARRRASLPGGAAERAGLRGGNQKAYLGNTPVNLGGDLIVAIDGRAIASD